MIFQDLLYFLSVLVYRSLRQSTVAYDQRVFKFLLDGDLLSLPVGVLILSVCNSSHRRSAVIVLSTYEDAQVMQIWKLLFCNDGVGGSRLTVSGSSTCSVDEELHLGREVKVDDIV